MFLAWVMHPGGQMHHRIDAAERFVPIGPGADRVDDDRIWLGRALTHGLPDDHAVGRQ
jgi:hypothetical protein